MDSSVIAAAGYEPASATLTLKFHSGGIYDYVDVRQTVYAGLLKAESAGQYFHEHILGRYRHRRR